MLLSSLLSVLSLASVQADDQPRALQPRDEHDAIDLALVRQFQHNAPHALGELYRRHVRRVESVARHLLGPSSELEDVVHEVFLELHRALPGFRGDARFTTWLHRITVNVTLMYLRKGRRKGFLRWVGLDDDDSRQPSSAPEARLDARETCRQLYDILGELPEKKYVVFALYELEGMPQEEIAATLGIGVNTVKTRLFHARRAVFDAARERGALPAFALSVVK